MKGESVSICAQNTNHLITLKIHIILKKKKLFCLSFSSIFVKMVRLSLMITREFFRVGLGFYFLLSF